MSRRLHDDFRELVDQLRNAGTLEAVDVRSIERLVMYRHEWIKGDIDKKIKLEPMIVRLEKLFGLNPGGRNNVSRSARRRVTNDDGRKNRYAI